MKEQIYLSLDLDYLNFSNEEHRLLILQIISKSGIPYKVVKDHHHLLKYVNKSRFTQLVNVDWHSDICDDFPNGKLPELECGTWVNWVKWRKQGKFLWVYPKKRCAYYGRYSGFCHGVEDIHNPFKYKLTKWKQTTARYIGADRLDQFLLKLLPNVKEIGIAVSPDWANMEIKASFYQWMRPKSEWLLYRGSSSVA